ncbi:MAG: molybdenum ABC transporter ATP-binding protein [Pseudomonadota bacterium]
MAHSFPGFDLDVSFEAPDGVTALFGRSGSGKTSIVNAVAGLLQPDMGRVVVEGEVLTDTAAAVWVPPHLRRVGYVFQEARLFPHLSVRRNLLYGARNGSSSEDQIIALLGLEALMARRPAGLSGGEKQRVAIGRALLSRPRVLLMDEPLASLDATRKAEVLPYLEEVSANAGVPILYVSHAEAEVARLARTVVALDEGRVAGVGPTAQVLAAHGGAVGSSGPCALLGGRVAARHGAGMLELAVGGTNLIVPGVAGAQVGDALGVRIAAAEVMIATARPDGLSAENVLAVEVTEITPSGGEEVIVRLALPDRTAHLLAQISRRSAKALDIAPGTPVFAVIRSNAVSLDAAPKG